MRGFHEKTFDELKRYVRFGGDDARLLAAFGPVAAPHFGRIAREFYERIREHEDAHAVFTGEEQIERLQRSMVAWMGRLLSGIYDDAYLEQTLTIGRIHVRVGLPQRYMFTAMALIRVGLEDIAASSTLADVAGTRRALTRLLDMELAIMLESYRVDREAQARRRDELEAEELRSGLQHALRMYEAATDAAPNLVIGLDGEGKIRLFNLAARTLTGYTLEEALGAPFIELLWPDDTRARDDELLATLFAEDGVEVAQDHLTRSRSGKIRDVHWRFSRVPSTYPERIVLFAVGSDVTDERAAASQLQRSERLAAVGTLAAGLAHEIRNPLNGAQLHVSFLRRALQKSAADPALLEPLDVVSDEIKRLASLVTEFLDFARPATLARTRFSMQDVVQRAVELTRPAAEAAGVTVHADLPPQALGVLADRGKLEQVLLNMIQNAVEALSPASGGDVQVRARRHPRFIQVEVEDRGPGLADNARVFDAFFSTKEGGTGLGLAITHRIVTDHGGTIDVASRRDPTVFRFTIPVGPDEADAAGEES
ncbi:MAG: hypothetical protein JWP97_4557 [Labilithrix sp.]|nr:hypothetical protein [Labilithrix sp.]